MRKLPSRRIYNVRKSILSIALSVAVLTLFLTLSTISIAGVANDPVILTGDDELTEPGDRGWTVLEQDRPDAPWITKWYMPARYTDNGTFAVSAPIDHVDAGSGGALTQASLSTVDGLMKTQTTKLDFGADHGGDDDWTVKEIDPADGNNMSTIYDGADDSNFDTWAIIVIESPKDHVAVMSPAHDDHAQIWVNGDKYWNDSAWTGGATKVNYDVPINLNEGANVLLYRCGEQGGSDYFNLHLDDTTMSAVSIFPKDSTDQDSFFKEISSIVTAVDSKSKLPVFWGAVKSTK
jgi:hypothetical protein